MFGMFGQQFCGINVVFFYQQTIFEKARSSIDPSKYWKYTYTYGPYNLSLEADSLLKSGGPPLEFINIQPQKVKFASRENDTKLILNDYLRESIMFI